MSIAGYSEAPTRVTTMVCRGCDVTWRGTGEDACWSCGDDQRVTEATPAKVRHSPAVADAGRLAG